MQALNHFTPVGFVLGPPLCSSAYVHLLFTGVQTSLSQDSLIVCYAAEQWTAACSVHDPGYANFEQLEML